MVCFGYEAKGDGTPDICYYTIDKQGHFTETVWIVSPVCAMIHDFAVTDNYVCIKSRPTTQTYSAMGPYKYIGIVSRYPLGVRCGSDEGWGRALAMGQ